MLSMASAEVAKRVFETVLREGVIVRPLGAFGPRFTCELLPQPWSRTNAAWMPCVERWHTRVRILLFRSQSFHRVDRRRPASWDEAGQKRRGGEPNSHSGQRRRIPRANAE